MYISFRNFTILLIFIVSLYYREKLGKIRVPKTVYVESTDLVLGILSARHNFLQRETARSTWLKNYLFEQKHVKYFFLIGNQSCKIAPEYRLSEYGCEKWNTNISAVQSTFFTSTSSKENITHNSVNTGFTFQINHPVVVKKLGVQAELLKKDKVVKVALVDIHNKEVVVEAFITKNRSVPFEGYFYTKVDQVVLPRKYEGLLLVEGNSYAKPCAKVQWNDNGGVISFKRIYTSPEYLDSKEFEQNSCMVGSIEFDVPDIQSLKEHVSLEESRTRLWQKKLEENDAKLKIERKKNKDFFVAGVTDTYRSLPVKLLRFYKWLNSKWDYLYLMKTDDDSVLDLSKIMTKLSDKEKFDHSKPWIWSRFRKDWPVNYIGKWSEPYYSSSLYPAFPCGAAYVMSHKTSQWLSENAHMLHPYQGEDVSLGIWLTAINPELMDDPSFECDAECSPESLNRGQLSAEQIRDSWTSYEKCQNLCGCSSEKLIEEK